MLEGLLKRVSQVTPRIREKCSLFFLCDIASAHYAVRVNRFLSTSGVVLATHSSNLTSRPSTFSISLNSRLQIVKKNPVATSKLLSPKKVTCGKFSTESAQI
jgi:hypothetical protein